MENILPKEKNNQIEYIRIGEAARILGVSIDTIRRYEKKGKLEAERLDGKNRYFRLERINEFISNKPLTISEVAERFKLSPDTIRRLENKGYIKPYRNSTGFRTYTSECVYEFLKSPYFKNKKNKPVDSVSINFKKDKTTYDVNYENNLESGISFDDGFNDNQGKNAKSTDKANKQGDTSVSEIWGEPSKDIVEEKAKVQAANKKNSGFWKSIRNFLFSLFSVFVFFNFWFCSYFLLFSCGSCGGFLK